VLKLLILALNCFFLIYDEKYNNYSDNDLINIFSETGNNALIGILYKRYGHLALGLCFKYLKNKDEAEDAVIQIFTNLIHDLKRYKIEYFKSWLYVYTKNYCLMELRKRQSLLKKELELHENALLFVDSEEPGHLEEKEKQIRLLEEAILTLNEGQKTCIHLFYIEERSYAEIAEKTGYSLNDVKSHIQNGKRNLKLKLQSLNHEREDQ
jgi:RNA polymerase sigma factor (sigma-70 family)